MLTAFPRAGRDARLRALEGFSPGGNSRFRFSPNGRTTEYDGIRATVVVHSPGDCPVAAVSAAADEPVDSVSRSSQPTAEGTIVEEFGVAADASVDGDHDVELTPIQSNDREAIYRFERDSAADCACEAIERTGTPVSSVRGQDGALLLSFRTVELSEIAAIVDELRAYFDGVVVEELSHDHDDVSGDPVVVDRDRLTIRQREILETDRR